MKIVGWVERSETHRTELVIVVLMGIASLHPCYGTLYDGA
jgi:hypothetical protein